MLRRVVPSVTLLGVAQQCRAYRLVPHIHYEIEELAEAEKAGRWRLSHHGSSLQQPLRRAELMCERLNLRERRRMGILPEKSIARRLSQKYAVDGVVHESATKTKIINLTVIGFDGHPFHFRLPPMPGTTLNTLIDGSGMCHGHPQLWEKCDNPDCADWNHGEGCIVNVDLETLDRLLPPTRWEYTALVAWRNTDRPDITYNTRFSCQIPLTAELDGGVFALKQLWGRSLREKILDWGSVDDTAVSRNSRSKRIEPWAPIVEEPQKADFPITLDMLWTTGYQDIMQRKYSNYTRKDGFHTRPEYWSTYI